MDITIWTDGGCHGNPGPGAWAFVITAGAEGRARILIEKSGSAAQTTNNRMELEAVINALEQTALMPEASGGVEVRTDSQYVQKGITEWIHSWKAKGWRTAGKTPVKNAELWKKLDALVSKRAITWRWVKGHAGNTLNERCDALVQQAIENIQP